MTDLQYKFLDVTNPHTTCLMSLLISHLQMYMYDIKRDVQTGGTGPIIIAARFMALDPWIHCSVY